MFFWESQFQKSDYGFGIGNLEILRAQFLRQYEQLSIFLPKFAQKWILVSNFQKSKSGFGISTREIVYGMIFRQNGQV